MIRPLLSLWPKWLQGLILTAPLLLLLVFRGPESCVEMIPVASVPLILYAWRARPYWRLCRQIGRFRTITGQQIVLHYSPRLEDSWDFAVLLERCQAELDELTRWFGFRLRRRAVIFLFAECQQIQRIFGPQYGGAALSGLNAIVVADDSSLWEPIRHELAHLFSARWNVLAPPILKEGLSTHLQGTCLDRPIDSVARLFLANPDLKLCRLLDRKFFFSKRHVHACYVLAGSFTGFLIRRYGWDRYRRFFRRYNGFRFRAKFARCFGVSLEKAEWQWHNELLILDILKCRLQARLGL